MRKTFVSTIGTLLVAMISWTGGWGEVQLRVPDEVLHPFEWASPQSKPNRLIASTDRSHSNKDYLTIPPKTTVKAVTIPGPGCIVRLWTTSDHPEWMTTKLVIESTRTTLVLCDRGKARFPSVASWGGMVGEAYYCYVPIPVKSRATLIATNASSTASMKFFYQINFSPDRNFQGIPVTASRANAIQDLWRTGEIYGRTGVQVRSFSANVRARRTTEVVNMKGPSVITRLEFECHGVSVQRLKDIWLNISWDGETSPSVRAPLPYLFCEYFGMKGFASLPLEATMNTDKNRFVLRLPMPFTRSARISLQWRARGPDIRIGVRVAQLGAQAIPGYRLHATYAATTTGQNRPFQILSTKGTGCLIGYTMGFDGKERRTLAFLEGNDQIEVDENPKLYQEGTGTEDAFNSAWYFRYGTFERLFCGVTFRAALPPRVSSYRFMFADRVSFRKSLKLQYQHGGRNSSPGCRYQAVAFWYQQPEKGRQ